MKRLPKRKYTRGNVIRLQRRIKKELTRELKKYVARITNRVVLKHLRVFVRRREWK